MKHDENLCAEIESTLPLYVGGDLETKALAEVRLHLSDCPRCSERALAARSARRELVAALRMESRPGPDLWAGVRAALTEEGVLAPIATPRLAMSSARPWWRSWGVAAAAAAVVLGFWIGSRWSGADEPAQRRPDAPAFADSNPSSKPRSIEAQFGEAQFGEPRITVTPVAAPPSVAASSADVALIPSTGPTGLRRLNPDERQLRDSAPEMLNDRAYLFGAPSPAGGAMQPVGLQRTGPFAPRW